MASVSVDHWLRAAEHRYQHVSWQPLGCFTALYDRRQLVRVGMGRTRETAEACAMSDEGLRLAKQHARDLRRSA